MAMNMTMMQHKPRSSRTAVRGDGGRDVAEGLAEGVRPTHRLRTPGRVARRHKFGAMERSLSYHAPVVSSQL